eukprot:764965-Hanusia_phi.AAC.2
MFILELRDSLGIKVDNGNYISSISLAFDVSPGYSLPQLIKEPLPNADGTYNIWIPSSLTRAGVYSLRVYISDGEMTRSPFNLTVVSAAADAQACRVRPMALGGVYTVSTAGVTGQFLLDIVDKFGNIVLYDPTIDIGLNANMLGPGATYIKKINFFSGLWEIDYVATRSGEYQMEITIADLHVRQSPFIVKVLNAEMKPSSSMVNITEILTAGVTNVFYIQSKDSYDNEVDTNGAPILAISEADPQFFSVSDISRIQPTSATLKYLAKGFYEGVVIMTKSGKFLFNLKYNSIHLQGSPFQITVNPSQIDGGMCVAIGSGTQAAISGEIATFTLFAYDRFSNRFFSGGEKFQSILRPLLCIEPSCELQNAVKFLDQNDGSYLGFYQAGNPGEYLMTIQVNMNALKGSPYRIQIGSPFPPIPTASWISGTGGEIEVEFDIATDMGGIAGSTVCEFFFQRNTAMKFGSDCTSFWSTPRTLMVRLGAGATILPGDDLSFAMDRIKNQRQTSYFTSGSVRLQAPAQPVTPLLIIDGPSFISSCDELLLDARISQGGGGRNLKFQWGVIPGGDVEDMLMASIQGQNKNFSCPDWIDVSSQSVCHSPILRLDPKIMTDGDGYTIVLTASNFFDQQSTVQHKITKVPKAGMPLLSIQGASTLNINPDEDTTIHLSVSSSICGSTNLSFAWTLISASGWVVLKNLDMNKRRLSIPKDSLEGGSEYIFMAELTSHQSNQTMTTNASILIKTSKIAATAQISQGSRASSIADSITLSLQLFGNVAYDSISRIEWFCDPSPCFLSFYDSISVDGSSLGIPAFSLLPGLYRLLATVTVQKGTETVGSFAAANIFVIPSGLPTVSISSSLTNFNSKQPVSLIGSPQSYVDKSYQYEWFQSRGGQNLLSDKITSISSRFSDTLGFAKNTLTEGMSYRYRLEVSNQNGFGFAQIDLSVSKAPSGGTFEVKPTQGFAVDTSFELIVSRWTDTPENLPLSYLFSYVLDVEDNPVTAIPFTYTDRPFQNVRIPNTNKEIRNASLLVQIFNMAQSGITINRTVEIKAPLDPFNSAETLRILIEVSSLAQDFDNVIILSSCLSSLLETSLSPTRRDQTVFFCPNDGTSCDNDDIRNFLLQKVKSSLEYIKPVADEISMLANSIQKTTSARMNRTSQMLSLSLTQQVIQVGVEQNSLVQFGTDAIIETFSQLLLANNYTLDSASMNQSERTAQAISDSLDRILNYTSSEMFVGQIPAQSIGSNLQFFVAKTRAVNATWELPVLSSQNLASNSMKTLIMIPSGILDNSTTELLASVDTRFVQWGSNPHPTLELSLGSNVLGVKLAIGFADQSWIEQKSVNEPIKIVFTKTVADRTNDIFDRCRYWDIQGQVFSRMGTIASNTTQDSVACEVYHMTEFSSVLLRDIASLDKILRIENPNPFLRWTPDRTTAVVALLVLYLIYGISCYFGRKIDKASLKILSSKLQETSADPRYTMHRSMEEFKRARDYVMIKSILKQRMATRYRSWKIQTLQLLKTEHILGGIFFRPVHSSFTRPRRITALFVMFFGNLALNILFLGQGAFDKTSRISAGIVSALIVLPIAIIFVSAFKSIDSDETWQMHRRRRVRRVQESVVLKEAGKILDDLEEKSLAVPNVKEIDESSSVAPPLPTSARPEFIRKASRSSGSPSSLRSASAVANIQEQQGAKATAGEHFFRRNLQVKSPEHLPETSAKFTNLPEADQGNIQHRPQTVGNDSPPNPPPPKGQNPRPVFGRAQRPSSDQAIVMSVRPSPRQTFKPVKMSSAIEPRRSRNAPAAPGLQSENRQSASHQHSTPIPAPPPRTLGGSRNRPSFASNRSLSTRSLPRRLFPLNSALRMGARGESSNISSLRRAGTVRLTGSRRTQFSSAEALPLPTDAYGPLSPIEEGDEERREIATLPTRAKPSRLLAQRRLDWLRKQLLNKSQARVNDLQLLLPPNFSIAVYILAVLWMLLCSYFIVIHGIRFSAQMEEAWLVAFVVSIIQDILIQQVLVIVFKSTFQKVLLPAALKNVV